MKILCTEFPCAGHFILTGWKNVLEHMGHTWHWWSPKQKSAFDAFSEVKPDIFIGTTYGLDRAIIKCLGNNPNTLVVLKANNWGKADNDIDPKEYPIGIADDKEKCIILELKKQIGKPDLIFNYYHKNHMEYTMGSWEEAGISTIDMQPAADLYSLWPLGIFDQNLQSDIAFVGGYWGYKAKNLDKYLLPICTPVGKYNVKIFGNQSWPYPQYFGTIDDASIKNLYASTTICPNIDEPHATDFGFELNHRIFQLAASKAFCISNPVKGISDVFNKDEMVVADDPEHFADLVHNFIVNPDMRLKHINECFSTVIQNHTYHHRIINLLNRLGHKDEFKIVNKLYEDIRSDTV